MSINVYPVPIQPVNVENTVKTENRIQENLSKDSQDLQRQANWYLENMNGEGKIQTKDLPKE